MVIGIEVFRRFVWKASSHRFHRMTAFIIIASIYGWRLSILKIHVERFHLLEYGILAILVTFACACMNLGFVSLLWGVIAVHGVGMADELFQYFWPDRYGEWRDVLINIQSGILANAALLLMYPHKRFYKRSSHMQWSCLFAGLSILSVLSGLFFFKVQVFGYEHIDSDIGRFKSYFPMSELQRTTPEAYQAFLKKTEQSPTPFSLNQKYWYEREGREHYDRARLLFEQNRPDTAKREFLIATRYFSAYLAVYDIHFKTEMVQAFEKLNLTPNRKFLSRVVDWMIVKVNRNQVTGLVWFSTILFFIAAVISAHFSKGSCVAVAF